MRNELKLKAVEDAYLKHYVIMKKYAKKIKFGKAELSSRE